ncbi:hypothetical protein CAL7716_085980 [Calothrix sp. PCC 7716]|nr:hypothetical protein CAL7716_085980 [Calothrix sp. PCC 7716]
MKYASSLLYGGMLVDAEKADYKDYARLLLRCPFCGEAVFLVAGKHREEHARMAPKSKQIVLVKASSVSPAFAHFPGIASQNCELRSAKINSSFIARCKTKSRNQRLKVFQNSFGKLFENNIDNGVSLLSIYKKSNQFTPDKYFEDIEKDMRRDFMKRFLNKNNLAEFKDFAKTLCEAALENPDKALRLDDNFEDSKAWLVSLELDLHLQIVDEVIDFLQTKTANLFIEKLFDKGFYAWLDSYLDNYNTQQMRELFTLRVDFKHLKNNYWFIVNGILAGAVAYLSGIQWADFIKDNQNI